LVFGLSESFYRIKTKVSKIDLAAEIIKLSKYQNYSEIDLATDRALVSINTFSY
jgi:hypothetical protein